MGGERGKEKRKERKKEKRLSDGFDDIESFTESEKIEYVLKIGAEIAPI